MTYRTQYGLQTRRCWSHLLLKVDSSKNTTFIHSSVVHKRCLVANSNLSTLFSRVKSGLWQDILLRSPTERRRSLMVVRDICRPSSCCVYWAVIKGSQQVAATINQPVLFLSGLSWAPISSRVSNSCLFVKGPNDARNAPKWAPDLRSNAPSCPTCLNKGQDLDPCRLVDSWHPMSYVVLAKFSRNTPAFKLLLSWDVGMAARCFWQCIALKIFFGATAIKLWFLATTAKEKRKERNHVQSHIWG